MDIYMYIYMCVYMSIYGYMYVYILYICVLLNWRVNVNLKFFTNEDVFVHIT